jgi:hypothetical protein
MSPRVSSAKYMIRDKALRSESATTVLSVPLLPCECFFPVHGLDISPVGEHGSQSSVRVDGWFYSEIEI